MSDIPNDLRMNIKRSFLWGYIWQVEKEMATHSSVSAWRIPGTAEPGGLPSTGSHRVGHDWSELAAARVTGGTQPRDICDYIPYIHACFSIAAAAKLSQSCPTLCDPNRRQPTRLLCPWDSPGKNTGATTVLLSWCLSFKLMLPFFYWSVVDVYCYISFLCTTKYDSDPTIEYIIKCSPWQVQ